MYRILEGLRIVEASAFVAAPTGGLTLAQLGADVIRVDPIGGGVDAKRWPLAESGASIYWASLNKCKRSITVNLRAPEGRELVADLVAQPGEGGGCFLTNLPARGVPDLGGAGGAAKRCGDGADHRSPRRLDRPRLHREQRGRISDGYRPGAAGRARQSRVPGVGRDHRADRGHRNPCGGAASGPPPARESTSPWHSPISATRRLEISDTSVKRW